ncbi:uncharacterized protein LOC120336667 isoform X2 [Styela clava]|uniref:multiple epidermal growth factor-like domains protein 6 isoform X2 n=1 Tax=Styela clava TaxID=7725 RepID=UPI00193ABE04|nr:multiple epidermal growth factor-like domains protein 6 isoform X2 [Styela clava]
MNCAGIFPVFLVLSLYAKSCFSCLSDDDCSYGGECDKILQRCTCNLACNRFTKPKLVCAGKKMPQTECKALNVACEQQKNIVLSPFDLTVFRKTGNCKKMVTGSIEEFCEDQTICSGNGICLIRVGQIQPYCRCVENYSGDRCHIKSPKLMPVADGDDTDTDGHQGNTVGKFHRGQ